ncbi:uncharacterized protein LOC124957211 [Vespa velutina]|uniref:uncharacterized protein LOC124957211 n=1 Tax=Vespa velutina TaxID=202808 RepID=UPI001FB1D452|nr:uncharacterized protein LOC124957211 [Vespa velutina]
MLSKEEDYIDNEYYTMNRKFFRLIGLWQGQTSSKNIVYIYFINLILTFASIGQIQLLFTSERNLMSIAKLLETVLPTLCFSCCYCNLLLNDRIMKKILYRIKSDWDDLADESELMIVKKYAEISRICTIIMTVCFYIYVVFLIFPSLLSVFRYVFGDISETELILPIRADYFLKNLMLYYIGLIIEYVIILVTCTVGIANYSMFIAVVQHACALFSIVQWKVKHRYEKLPHNSYYVKVESELDEENEWIVDLIKFYKSAIEFVDLLKSFYESVQIIAALLSFTFVLVDYIYLFQVLSFSLNRIEGIEKLLFIVCSMFVIYIYTYVAQNLMDHNANIFLIFCQFPFYSLSLRNQKLLLFLTMYSMRLCGISLMGAVFISHELFAKMKKILYRMKFDWDELANKPELVILKKYAEISRLCTITIASKWLTLYTEYQNVRFRYVIGSIGETELILPIHIDYIMKNRMLYYIGLTTEYVTISIVCTKGIANYSMFIAIIQHACALFTIVQWRVKERFERSPPKSYYCNGESELLNETEWIVVVIKFYKHAIDYFRYLLGPLIGPIYFCIAKWCPISSYCFHYISNIFY